MKKTLLLIIAILLNSIASGQMAVIDATANKQLTKTAIETAKQTQQMEKSVELMKEQKSRLEKVSKGLKKLQLLDDIVTRNSKLVKRIGKDADYFLSNPYLKNKEVKIIRDSYSNILKEATADMSFINDLIKDGVFKVDDGRRLQLLKEQEENSKDLALRIEMAYKHYDRILQYRAFKEAAENAQKEN